MLKRTLWIIVLLLAITSAGVLYVGHSEFGMRLLATQVRRLESMGLRIEGLSGTVAGPLYIARLELDEKQFHLVVDNAVVDMRLADILLLHIHATSIQAGKVAVVLKSAPDEPPSVESPRFLPSFLRVIADRVVVNSAQLTTADGRLIDAGKISTALRLSPRRLRLRDIAIAAPDFAVAGKFTLEAARPMGVSAALTASLRTPFAVPSGQNPAPRASSTQSSSERSPAMQAQGMLTPDAQGSDAQGEARLSVNVNGTFDKLNIKVAMQAPSVAELDARFERSTDISVSRLGPSTALTPEQAQAQAQARRVPPPEMPTPIPAVTPGVSSAPIRAAPSPNNEPKAVETTPGSAPGYIGAGGGWWKLAGHVSSPAFSLAPWMQRPPVSFRDTQLEFLVGSDDIKLLGDAIVPEITGAPLRVDVHGRYKDGELLLGSAQIGLKDQATVLRAQGSVRLSAAASALDLALSWNQLRWPLTGSTPLLASPAGRAKITGSMPYRFDVASDLDVRTDAVRLAINQLRAQGELSKTKLSLDRYSMGALGGTLAGAGGLQFDSPQAWNISLQAQHLNPQAVATQINSRFNGQFPGDISFTAAGQGKGLDTHALFTADLSNVRGVLRGQPLSGGGGMDRDTQGWRARQMRVVLGHSKLRVDGVWREALALSWDFHSDSLAGLVPDAAGKLSFSGRAQGARARPHVTSQLAGSKLRYGEWLASDLAGNLDVYFDDTDKTAKTDGKADSASKSSLSLEAHDAGQGESMLSDLRLAADGTLKQHNITLRATAADASDVRETESKRMGSNGARSKELGARTHNAKNPNSKIRDAKDPGSDLDSTSPDSTGLESKSVPATDAGTEKTASTRDAFPSGGGAANTASDSANVTANARKPRKGRTGPNGRAGRAKAVVVEVVHNDTARHEPLQIAVDASGGYDKKVWTGQLTRVHAGPVSGQALVELASPVELSVSTRALSMQQLCLHALDGRFCAQGDWRSNGPWHVAADATEVPLRLLDDATPERLRFLGTVSSQIHFNGEPNKPWVGEANATLRDGAITWQVVNGDAEALTIGSGELKISATPQEIAANLQIAAPPGSDKTPDTVIEAQARLDRHGGGDLTHLPLTGTLHVHTAEASSLPLFLVDVDRAAGILDVNVRVNGTAAQPQLDGQIDISQAALDVYRLNLALRDFGMTASFDANRLIFDGGAHIGEGTAGIGGALHWDSGQLTGTLHMEGDKLLVADLPDYRVVAAPKIDFHITGREIDATGQVVIPSARIQPKDLSSARQVSADARLVNEAPVDSSDLWTVHSEIRVAMGDDVKIDTFGLQAKLQGSVDTLTGGDVAVGRGELSVADGKYDAYGQKLDITRGRLLFQGSPLDDPGLDITAQKKIEDVVAGLNVRGTLRAPRLSFFSDPSMSQTQILSYLIMGKPMDDLQDSQKQAVGSASNSASSSMALQGGGYLVSKLGLGQRLGIDQVGVESDTNLSSTSPTGTTTNTSLVLGKFLSPRLFVSYGISLTQAINTLKMRYTLSDRWVLKLEGGEVQSADIEFRVEK